MYTCRGADASDTEVDIMALDPELRGLSSDDEGDVGPESRAPQPLIHLPVVIPPQADLVDLPPRCVRHTLTLGTEQQPAAWWGTHHWSLCQQLVGSHHRHVELHLAITKCCGGWHRWEWAGRISKQQSCLAMVCCSTGAGDGPPAEQPADEALPDQSMQHAVPAAEPAASKLRLLSLQNMQVNASRRTRRK